MTSQFSPQYRHQITRKSSEKSTSNPQKSVLNAYMEVSEHGGTPKSRIFHHKPSIFGYLHFKNSRPSRFQSSLPGLRPGPQWWSLSHLGSPCLRRWPGTQRAWRGAVERGRSDGGLPRAGCAAGGWPGADLWGRRVGRRCWDFNRFPMGMGFQPMIFMVFP